MTPTGNRLEDCCVPEDATLLDVLRSLEASETQIALIVDRSRRLLGTMTDGDVRRALLQGRSLDSPLRGYVTTQFTSVGPRVGRNEVLDLMQARAVNQVPVVDEDHRLVGLHLLRELLGRTRRPNWAVVMAGGKGLRLRPVTEHIPKPMLEVAGRPILERTVLHLVGYGVERIFLAVNYLAEVIRLHFGNGERFGCRIDYLVEKSPLGTGGALTLLPHPPVSPVIVLNGDLVVQFDVERLLGFHADGGYSATLAYHEYAHTVPYGVLTVEEDRVVAMKEKPTVSWQTNAGIYVLSPEVIECLPRNSPLDMTGILEDCIDRGVPVGAFPLEGEWIDVGHHAELRRARGNPGG